MNEDRSVYIASKPSNGAWHPLGQLTFKEGVYTFAYLKGIHNQIGQVNPLPGMQELDQVYQSEHLFPFFENRLLSKKRKEYKDFLAWSGFSEGNVAPPPLAILGITEGKKVTDSYEVFPCPRQNNKDGMYEFQFFLHGLNHIPATSQEVALNLEQGNRLFLMADLQNAYNPAAMTLRTENSHLIGYLPNYLANEAYRLLKTCDPQSTYCTVSRVNLDAPMSFAVLCKLKACWSNGSSPFSDEAFQPISALAPKSGSN